MKDLLNEWSEIQTQPRSGMQTVGSIQERTNKEMQILEALLAAGCSQIPNESFDVRFMLQDRRRTLQEMHDRLSRI